MPACLWAAIVQEGAYRTAVASPVLNESYVVLDLFGDDPVSLVETPVSEELRTWLACNAPDRIVGDTSQVAGSIRTLLYPEQAPILLRWALQKVDQTLTPDEPWTTTEPAGQLGSMTIHLAYYDDAATLRKEQFDGAKVNSMTLAASRDNLAGAFELTLDVTASTRSASTFVEPPAADYPTSAPYALSHSSGGVLLDGNAITNYDSLSIAAENTNQPRFDESATVSRIRTHGRQITAALSGLLKFSPDLRALFLARTQFDASITLTHPNTTHAIMFDFGARAYLPTWERQLPIAEDRTQSLELRAMFDRVTGVDFATTFTVPGP